MSHTPLADQLPGYAGDVSPAETFAGLQDDLNAVLVDCRTHAEWRYVGRPDLTGIDRRLVLIEWQNYPEGDVNPAFVDKLHEKRVSLGAPVYFLCRSGVRSKAAAIAATQAGFTAAFNVVEGFEGDLGPSGVRDEAGWKVEGLPWRQS